MKSANRARWTNKPRHPLTVGSHNIESFIRLSGGGAPFIKAWTYVKSNVHRTSVLALAPLRSRDISAQCPSQSIFSLQISSFSPSASMIMISAAMI